MSLTDTRAPKTAVTVRHFIGGESVEPAGGDYLDNIDPATGAVYGRTARGTAADVERAVEAARAAFPAWSETPADERSRILLRLASLLEERLEEFAHAESVDTGKPIRVARSLDIPRAVRNTRFFATAILHTRSDAHITDRRAINYTLRRPRGVAGLISPWNLPLYLFTWKVAPAIATGNTAVAKPSEITPVTASLFANLAAEAGLPAGVLNVVHGLGAEAGAALVSHPEVGTISFTGGTVTGRAIAKAAAPHFKKLTLEMGGKNPNIIFADADLDRAVRESVRSSFANQGQVCLCGSRIFVERSIAPVFTERFLDAVRAIRIGDPLDGDTDHGALVSDAQREKVLTYIALAEDEGGSILCGGGRPNDLPPRCRNGYFVAPTVITGLGPGCRVNQEEIFGPLVTIMPFDTEDEVVAYANATRYGLSASVWTENISRAHRIADRIQSGTVWVNCWLLRDLRVPFGGIKESGVGGEGGEAALDFFTEPKNVCIEIPRGGAA